MQIDQINQTFGKTFADHLSRVVLAVGSIQITAFTLVNEVGCANVVAAQRLSATLRRLHITTLKQLAKIDPASLYRVEGCGHTQVYVAMCLLEHHGIDPGEWWGWAVKGEAVRQHARAKKKRGAHPLPARKSGKTPAGEPAASPA